MHVFLILKKILLLLLIKQITAKCVSIYINKTLIYSNVTIVAIKAINNKVKLTKRISFRLQNYDNFVIASQ